MMTMMILTVTMMIVTVTLRIAVPLLPTEVLPVTITINLKVGVAERPVPIRISRYVAMASGDTARVPRGFESIEKVWKF